MKRKLSDAMWEDTVTLEKIGKRANKVWKQAAELLRRPRSIRPEVNIEKISKLAKEGEVVVVPGKVLSGGDMKKKVTVVSYSISQGAREKLEQAGCQYFEIVDYAKQNPNVENVRLVI